MREVDPGPKNRRADPLPRPSGSRSRRRFLPATGSGGSPNRREVDHGKAGAKAMTYSPRFEEEHEDALRQDWAHVPIPRERAVVDRGVKVGDRLAALLDASREADATVSEVIGLHRMRHLAVLATVDDAPIRPDGEELTIAYFGGGRGKFIPRPFHDEENALVAWGGHTGDLWLNKRVFVQNVPVNVWEFEIGGYPVLKKWLGYRQSKRRGGKPMTIRELRTMTGIVRRLAALLELRVELDEIYEAVSTDAFTAIELGLREA
jgi:Type ISP C-terminal specificity domain